MESNLHFSTGDFQMSSSMTMAQLIAAVVAAAPNMSEYQAYKAIKEENLRSQKRIDEFAGTVKELSAEQIVEKYGNADQSADGVKLPTAQPGAKKAAGGEKKTAKKSSTKKASGKTPSGEKKARKPRGEVRIVEAGPRGFRFGRKWNEAVQAGEGIAVHPNHINKLKAHAEAVGYRGSLDVEPAKLAAAIASNKNFDLDNGFKGAEE
jgi:hypothetical protein